MYNIFKKIMIASLMMVAIVSCDNEDYLIFTAVNEKEVKFQNEFLPVYKLSSATASNVAERLVWNEPDLVLQLLLPMLLKFLHHLTSVV